MCGTNRPADFKVPDDYVLTERERERVKQESAAENQFQAVSATCRSKSTAVSFELTFPA